MSSSHFHVHHVVERLERLYRKLDEEGWHTDANTIALAIEEIGRPTGMTKAEVLDAIKAACGPSRSAWARSLGLSPTYINDVVNGRRPPSKAVLDAIGVEKTVDYKPKAPANG